MAQHGFDLSFGSHKKPIYLPIFSPLITQGQPEVVRCFTTMHRCAMTP